MTTSTTSTSEQSLADVVEDLETRFLSSIPQSECTDDVRLFVQVQQAHWFYVDNLKHYKGHKKLIKKMY